MSPKPTERLRFSAVPLLQYCRNFARKSPLRAQIGARSAGATIFLVPPQEYKDALSKIRPGLQVYAVSTLNQALQVLAAHGGAVPPAPTRTPPAVTPGTAAG